MNKQISAPRGSRDKNKEMGIREYKEQLTEPRKPHHWKKLRLTCEPRQNGTDTFNSQHLGIDISGSKEQMWQYNGENAAVCYIVSCPSVCKQETNFSSKHLNVYALLPLQQQITQAQQRVVYRHLPLLFIDLHSNFVQTNFSCTCISSDCQQHLQNSNACY